MIPTDPLREPTPQGARALCAHHQSAIVVNLFSMPEQNDGILEILGVYGQRMLAEHPSQCAAAIKRYATRSYAEIRQAPSAHAKRQSIFKRLETREKSVGLDHDAGTC